MNQKYVYSQQPSYLMDLNATFNYAVCTFNLWHSNSYDF